MRLSLHLSLTLGALIALILALDCAWRLNLAVDEVRADFAGRATRQGALLTAAAAHTWQHQGEAAAETLVRDLGAALNAQVEWLPPAEMPAAMASDPTRWARLLAGEALPPEATEDDARSVAYLPVVRDDGRVGAVLALSRARSLARAEVWRAVRQHLLLLLFELAGLLVGVYWAIRRQIGQPLAQLTELARRIGDSDFGARVLTRRDDEVGRLARQMNTAAEQLQAARVAAEQASRQELVAKRALRHAERLKTVGQLGAGIAHELGTPLNVVVGRAKMILKGYVEGDELTESARIIAEQGERMTTLIHELLTFARRRPAEHTTVALGPLVDDTAKLLQPLLHKQRAQVEAAVAPDLTVHGDAAALQQVLTNLIMNAADAGARTIRVSAEAAADEVVLRVADDGEGMPPEVAAHVFDPFYTTKAVDQGTGLGLSITFGIVRDHDGHIHVESTPGEGTTFVVTLPRRGGLGEAPGEGARG